ncbi:hypothetical protein P5P81_05475 [Tritonibacter mobilis]|nr:hypothetical protein [Tritonibacter mobilis]
MAAELLNDLSSMDDRHRPLMLVATQIQIDAGVEDAETITLHLYALHASGDAERAEELARMALETASEPEDLGRLDALIAEIAYGDQRYEEALHHWRASMRKDEETSLQLNNCGAALQHLGRPEEAALSFLAAARKAREAGSDDPESYRSRGSACVNMAMSALERGRTGTAVSLARLGAERYRDLLARHPGHSDMDAAELFAPLVVALDEAGRVEESVALAEECLKLARGRYRDNNDLGARGLIGAITTLHGTALETGQYDLARTYSDELRVLAERHFGQPFGLSEEELALAIGAEADALFLAGRNVEALEAYDRFDRTLSAAHRYAKRSEVFITRLNHAMALNSSGQREEAAQRLSRAVQELEEHAVSNGWLWVLVARGYSDLAIVESERGREAEALSVIESSRSAMQKVRAGGRNQWINSVEQQIAIANALSHLGSYREALEMLHELAGELERLATESSDAAVELLLFQTLNDLGLIAHAAEEYLVAEASFGRAAKLGQGAEPNSVLAQRVANMLINRAGALADRHEFTKANKVLDRAEPLLGDEGEQWQDYYNNRAVVLSGQGKTEEALSCFRQARDFVGEEGNPYLTGLNIAATLADLERWPEAREEAQAVVQMTEKAVFDPDGVDPITLYFWIASRIVAARASAFLETPGEAFQETEDVLSAFQSVKSHLGPDRLQLHGYALEAAGDACNAAGQQDRADAFWSEAKNCFVNSQARLWEKEVGRLNKKLRTERII